MQNNYILCSTFFDSLLLEPHYLTLQVWFWKLWQPSCIQFSAYYLCLIRANWQNISSNLVHVQFLHF